MKTLTQLAREMLSLPPNARLVVVKDENGVRWVISETQITRVIETKDLPR